MLAFVSILSCDGKLVTTGYNIQHFCLLSLLRDQENLNPTLILNTIFYLDDHRHQGASICPSKHSLGENLPKVLTLQQSLIQYHINCYSLKDKYTYIPLRGWIEVLCCQVTWIRERGYSTQCFSSSSLTLSLLNHSTSLSIFLPKIPKQPGYYNPGDQSSHLWLYYT